MVDHTYNLNGSHKPNLKRTADRNGPDYFPTPGWATRTLIMSETFKTDIWEPACGDGSMSRILRETGLPVLSTDLYDRGFGKPGGRFSDGEEAGDQHRHEPALQRR